jgi:sRNA-binding protein
MLLSGDYETMKEQKKEIKTNVEIGDLITSKEINGKTYSGIVKNISKKSVTIELDDGKLIRLYYPVIAKIEGKKKMIKKTDIKTIKPNEGDKIKVKISGKIQTGTVIKVNPTRLRVRFTDGKEWYVPYNMILELV